MNRDVCLPRISHKVYSSRKYFRRFASYGQSVPCDRELVMRRFRSHGSELFSLDETVRTVRDSLQGKITDEAIQFNVHVGLVSGVP